MKIRKFEFEFRMDDCELPKLIRKLKKDIRKGHPPGGFEMKDRDGRIVFASDGKKVTCERWREYV